jgi:hypothetical protein
MKRALLITSHKNNAPALEHLFESLVHCEGIDRVNVIAVVGGYDTFSIGTRGPFTLVQVPHNSIDFTGLLAVLDTPELHHESYFYMHDTTRAGPRFVQRVMDLPDTTQSASFRFPSMNIGLYSHTLLEDSKNLLETFRNTNESRAQDAKRRCVEMEDCIFRSNATHQFLSTGPPLVQGEPRDYYGSGVPRRVEYYPSMDLYKIKANWYVKSAYQLSA